MDEYYVRVECWNNEEEKSMGGYMCAAMLVMSLILDVPPTFSDEELMQLIEENKTPETLQLLSALTCLADIPKPEIYVEDHVRHICLYRANEFDEALYDLEDINQSLEEMTDGRFSLFCLKYDNLNEEDILYEDPYQIVISRETYEKKKPSGYDPLDVVLMMHEE